MIKCIYEDILELMKARLSLLVVFTSIFGYLLGIKGTSEDILLSSKIIVGVNLLIGISLCAFGAAVFNQLMEVDFDLKMQRTSKRPLPDNRMPKELAFFIGWLFSSFGIIHLSITINLLTALISGLIIFIYLFIYTPMKKVSSLNTLVGGVSGALPPVSGWAASSKFYKSESIYEILISQGSIYVFIILFLWQMPHFISINWIYRDDYKDAGFIMWSNNDEKGVKSSILAIFFSAVNFLFGIIFSIYSSNLSKMSILPILIINLIMLVLCIKFLKTKNKQDARKLFFYTLIYLPINMIISFIFWNNNI